MTERKVSSERVSGERLGQIATDKDNFYRPEIKAMAQELLALRSSVKTVPAALEQLRIAIEAEAAAKAKRDQFLATIYVNVQKNEPTAEFAVALRDFVREGWPKLSATEPPASASEVTEEMVEQCPTQN